MKRATGGTGGDHGRERKEAGRVREPQRPCWLIVHCAPGQEHDRPRVRNMIATCWQPHPRRHMTQISACQAHRGSSKATFCMADVHTSTMDDRLGSMRRCALGMGNSVVQAVLLTAKLAFGCSSPLSWIICIKDAASQTSKKPPFLSRDTIVLLRFQWAPLEPFLQSRHNCHRCGSVRSRR